MKTKQEREQSLVDNVTTTCAALKAHYTIFGEDNDEWRGLYDEWRSAKAELQQFRESPDQYEEGLIATVFAAHDDLITKRGVTSKYSQSRTFMSLTQKVENSRVADAEVVFNTAIEALRKYKNPQENDRGN